MDVPRRFEIARRVPVGMSSQEHFVSNSLGWGVEFIESGGPVAVMFNDHEFIMPGDYSSDCFSAPIKLYAHIGAMLAFERCVYKWIDEGDGLFCDTSYELDVWITPAMWARAREAENARMAASAAKMRAKYGPKTIDE